jgi:uncharacterized protein YvpB
MKRKLNVPYLDQSVRYPTGCESVSTVMLLHYLGCHISVDDFIQSYLKMQGFENRNGELFGPDPNRFFCGSPYDPDSFGCYAPVICDALSACLGDEYQVIDETGAPTERLLEEYIDQGMPVIFWACINMREPITGPCWRLKDSGETFTWISNEHCMLLVGYDEDSYIFNDPYENHGVIHYPRLLTEERHKAQYSMAVGIKKSCCT